ncbi:gp53-like domain-containing protein [Aeromonas veronii]|uniref:gp53-like domain-containing protein n=1 Tax=Aeromonas veronii TaxID=654 RepID=UPI00123C6C25|nr:hypothetical protein [Aeromonas veronii]QET79798.1 hypothetical protein FOB40_11330 [Aeromonas veronii]
MHRIDTPSRQKDKFGSGKDGFTKGDPQTGTPATEVSPDILDAMQEEIAAVIEDSDSGLTLNKNKNNQLVTAIKNIISSVGMLATEVKIGVMRVCTQSEANAGVIDNAVITPKKLRYGFSIQTGDSGYIALPSWLGGWICQWGSAMANQSESATGTLNTFPMTYPRACSLIVASDYASASAACATFATGAYATSGFRCWARNPAAAGAFVTAVGRYISIGN